MLTFRPVTPADAPLLSELRRAFQAFEPFPNPLSAGAQAAVLQQLLTDPRAGRAWLLELAGAPVGYAVLAFGFSLEYGGRNAWLDELFLAESARGRGLGSLVLDFLADFCRAEAIRALHLEVDDHNQPAQRLYRRNGFAGTGRQMLTRWL